MKRNGWIVVALLVAALVCTGTAAHAAGIGGVFTAVKEWIGGNAVALLLTGILAIGVVGAFVARYTAVIGAFGWLLVEIDNAASDRKITKEELAALKTRWNAVRDAALKAKANA